MYFKFTNILFLLILIIFSYACTKDKKPISGVTNRVILTTTPILSVGSDSAICGATITSDGGDFITDRGICWSTSTNPIVSQNSTRNGSGLGTFSSILKPLLPNTNYYVRAYVNNAQGIIYGNQLSFKTKVPLPIIQTNAATSITQTAATIGGSGINDFGFAITQKGICWSTTNFSPDINNNVVSVGTGTSSFSINIQNFSPNTIYYARAFASNLGGTSYGNTVQFKTLPYQLPNITTTSISNITRTSAFGGGNVINDGGLFINERGVCWSTLQNPTISNSRTNNGIGTGTFLSSITGLQAGTIYYVRAYASNALGTSYGNQISFRTNF